MVGERVSGPKKADRQTHTRMYSTIVILMKITVGTKGGALPYLKPSGQAPGTPILYARNVEILSQVIGEIISFSSLKGRSCAFQG